MCWDELSAGGRQRHWCQYCRAEGKEWLTPEPCHHILEATEKTKISNMEIQDTLKSFQETDARPG
jgi:hypothetical protein